MAIRVILRANIETLVLIHFAGSDPGSWLHALLEDLVWLSSCLPDAKFTFTDWCHFVRCPLKKARCIVRKACSSDTARSLTIAEGNKDVAALVSSHTCFCGASFRSKAALDGHRDTHHGVINLVQWYCYPDNTCRTCLVQFDNRGLLSTHLSRGCGTCWLNMIVWVPPLSTTQLADARKHRRRLGTTEQR